ncbi:hypothetical protein AgCh_036272 [Apium graveolens]
MMVENVNAFEYLMGEDPKSRCRAFFDHNNSCEHLSNNFSEKTCSCVQWQLRGFPCQHAVCALQQIIPNWVNYCARYYSVDNYKITYASEMVPLEGPNNWEKPGAIIVPPLLIRKQGMPRKNRRKAYDETFQEKKIRCCNKCIAQGLVAAYKKRKVKLPEDSASHEVYYDPSPVGTSTLSKLALTNDLRFLNKAAIIMDGDVKADGSKANAWTLCSVQRIEKLYLDVIVTRAMMVGDVKPGFYVELTGEVK